MQLIWKRTTIGGEELHHDFCAYVENINIARIMREKDADHRDFWNVHFHVGDAVSDSCLTRRDAIEWVETRFVDFLSTEAGKLDTQEWPHDQRSAQLRYLRGSDSSAYREMVADLRAGRLERIQRKQ